MNPLPVKMRGMVQDSVDSMMNAIVRVPYILGQRQCGRLLFLPSQSLKPISNSSRLYMRDAGDSTFWLRSNSCSSDNSYRAVRSKDKIPLLCLARSGDSLQLRLLVAY